MANYLLKYLLFSVQIILLYAVLPGIYQRKKIPVTNWIFNRMANDRINKYTKGRKFSIKTMIYRRNSGASISNIAKLFLQI
jgi:hypothetical protein